MSSKHQVASGHAMLATDVVGTGDPVVFLHANVCDRRMWRAQLDAIGSHYKAIAYDRRGFGETRADEEDFSAVADLKAVIDSVANGGPVILVGCSQGGKIAIDAALRHPSQIRALVLIAPSVGGAPEVVYSSEIKALLTRQSEAEDAGDLDQVSAIKARLWLDGPLAPEGRIVGQARQLFLDMNAFSLRPPQIGLNHDVAPSFHRLGEIQVPSLVIWGDFDFPHIQERCRHVVTMMSNGLGHEFTGVAHLPSLERPTDITATLMEFLERYGRAGAIPSGEK